MDTEKHKKGCTVELALKTEVQRLRAGRSAAGV
jgi:hypothetical protein